MTILADIRRLNVDRAFARRISAIVATGAVVRNVGVIEVGGGPRNGCMTVIAIVAAG